MKLIEEKAKAYDEAKARMSRAYNSNRCTIGFMNEIFPELKESEDEKKIQESLMQYLWDMYHKEFYPPRPTMDVCDKWIAWLEKQGEQKPIDKDGVLNILNKENQQIQQEDLIMKPSLSTKQNTAWSKEDENEVAILEAYIRSKEWSERHIDRALGIVDELVNKCKSLENRVGCEANCTTMWKPSEKQMEALKEACDEHWEPDGLDPLYTLYQELKKLRGE